MRPFAAIMLSALSVLLQGPEADKLRALPLANDALALAVEDVTAQPVESRVFLRYLWITDGDLEAMQAVSLAVNIPSRATSILRPVPVRRDKLLLLRVDLRHYAPQFDGQRINDLQEWIDTWEQLQFDPRLNLLLTQDTLKFAADTFGADTPCHVRREKWAQVPTAPYQHEGQTFNVRWQRQGFETAPGTLGSAKDIIVARLAGPHLDAKLVAALVGETQSQAALVTHHYFVARALSAIRDDNNALFATIYGGLYYDLAGVRTGARKGTDLDVLLQDLGVGDVDKGIDARKLFDRLRSDQRVAIFRSDVTAGPREVDLLPILSGRLDGSTRIASVTNDLKQSNIDIGKHPLFNLLGIKPDAHEVIWTRPNGLHGYALFNGAGARQDEAPPDVAKDHTIPAPHHGRLQPAISCIACHEADGSEGWKPLRNDAKVLLGKVEVFGDAADTGKTVPDTLDRIAGLYQGDPERALSRGRDDLSAAVLRATGPMRASIRGQADVVKVASNRLVSIWRGYQYDLVTPQRALAELGIEADAQDGERLLNRLLPVRAAGHGITPEDPRLVALKAGIGINRSDWDLAYGFAAARAQKTISSLKGGK